jgi:hypothetical protein
MEKFKNALKSVNKFGILALALVAFATMAFKAPATQNVKWGYDQEQSQWVPAPDDNYSCDGVTDFCTRLYPLNQDPNIDDTNYSGEISGTFTPF